MNTLSKTLGTNLVLVLGLISFLLVSKDIHAQQTKKPNIILILTDDQGWADAGFNGATDILTPHLDKLAKEGVTFTSGYVSHPYCSPSRAGILSGRYQARFGHDCNMTYDKINDNSVGMPLSEKTIAEALKEQGYKTAAIGKWHVGDHSDLHPPKQGFDYWYGFVGGGMNFWGTPDGPLRTVVENGSAVAPKSLSYLTDDFTDATTNFIESNKDKPFFVYLAYNAPHAPNHATQEYLEKTKHIEYGGRSIYAAMVSAIDAGMGKIDDVLAKNNLKDNTIVVFLSDNGGRGELADNRPFRGHKGMLFEGGIRVPFVMRWPGKIDAGSVYQEPVISLDLFPTFLKASGGNPSKEPQLEGTDLLPYLANKKTGEPHDKLYWRSVGGFEYAVRDSKYKLYKSAYKEKTLLFDLELDPYERTDIASENPEIIARLEADYVAWDKNNIDPKWLDPHEENVIKESVRWKQEREKSTASTNKK